MLLKILFVLICVVACTFCSRREGAISSSRINRDIKKYLKLDENRQNVIKLLTWNLKSQEDNVENLCKLIERSDPTLLGLQQIRYSHIVKLKKCFAKTNIEKCKKPRRRGGKKRGNTRKCGFEILGAGRSNEGESTLFTPVIFQQRRGIRTTGNHGTLWLSKTPDKAFSKLPETSEIRIASWIHLKVAVFERQKKSKVKKENSLEKLLMVFNKVSEMGKKKKKRPTTKWIDLYVVNTQLDDVNANIAKQQVEILMEQLKDKSIGNDQSVVLLTAGINPNFINVVSEIMENEGGFVNARDNARKPVNDQKFIETTTIWSKGLENMFSIGININYENQKQGPVLSVLVYK